MKTSRTAILRTIAAISLSLLAVSAFCIPRKPVPPRLVNDYADLFTPSQEAGLEMMLTAFDDSTSNQIAVVTVNDLEGYSPAEFGTRIGIEWQVGSEKFDNGIVIVVKPKTENSKGEVNISVGYGLEGAIPDAYAKRIIENNMIPHFRTEDYYGGVEEACTVLMKLASGEISEPDSEDDGSYALLILFFILFIIFTVIILRIDRRNGGNRGRRIYDDGDIASSILIGNLLGSSGRGSSGWSGGGGFGGGFGGFGGGSFGGGGASGSW